MNPKFLLELIGVVCIGISAFVENARIGFWELGWALVLAGALLVH